MYEDMTYEKIMDGMLSKVPSDVDKREGSIIYDAVGPCSFYIAQVAFMLRNFPDLLMPDTAEGEYLERFISAFGIVRKPSTRAIRKMSTSGPVDTGTRWGINDIVFTVISRITDNEYQIVCETAGDIGNQYSGIMYPVSNVTGVDAELSDIITPGADSESCSALRERFYQAVRLPATSGNVHHYKMWAMEVPGVGGAKVYPLDNGPGTVTVIVVDSKKRSDASLESAVSEHIVEVRPIGATVTVSIPAEIEINVTANVLLDGTKTASEVEEAFEKAFTTFLAETVFREYRVSYAKIGSMLLDTVGVEDYDSLKINGNASNVVIDDRSIPVCGTITLQEVSALATA